jgi:hypothetical protein
MSAIIHPPGQPISGETSHGGRAPDYPRLVMTTTILASSLVRHWNRAIVDALVARTEGSHVRRHQR